MESTTGLMSPNTALNEIFSCATPLAAQETLSLIQCFNHILTSDVVSPLGISGFDSSAMDGYTMRLADIVSGQPLPITGKSFASQPYYDGQPTGTCIHTMTGVPVPRGCRVVIMQEQTGQTSNDVRFIAKARSRQDTRRRGGDVSIGTVAFPTGTHLTTAKLPVTASLGITEVPVIRKVCVAPFSAGDESQLPGQPLSDSRVYDINRLAMCPMLEQSGYEVINLETTRDDPYTLCIAFIEADSQVGVVTSSGGISVGETGYTKTVLEELEEIVFQKLAIRPDKPFTLGKLSNSWFYGLSGNPVSATLTFYQPIQPSLARLNGNTASGLPACQRACTASRLKRTPGRLDFQRGVLQCNADGELEVMAAGHQGSHIFSSLNPGDCFIILGRKCGSVDVDE